MAGRTGGTHGFGAHAHARGATTAVPATPTARTAPSRTFDSAASACRRGSEIRSRWDWHDDVSPPASPSASPSASASASVSSSASSVASTAGAVGEYHDFGCYYDSDHAGALDSQSLDSQDNRLSLVAFDPEWNTRDREGFDAARLPLTSAAAHQQRHNRRRNHQAHKSTYTYTDRYQHASRASGVCSFVKRKTRAVASFFSRRSTTTSRSHPRSTTKLVARPKSAKMIYLALFLILGALLLYVWRREESINAPWTPDAPYRRYASEKTSLPPPSPERLITSYTLPLRTSGRSIVDARGRRFKLLSVNWYGASDVLFVPGGLDVRHRDEIAATIRKLGFNSVRMPYADEIVVSNPVVDPEAVSANPDLVGKTALDVFEACVRALTGAGLAVIVNNHITHATWCCGADPCDSGWRNDHLSPPLPCKIRQTEEDWIEHWQEIMARLADDPYVIGADLRNEVRGLWGTMPWSAWAAAAERAGNRLLRTKKDWLIVVGGTESNNDLSGVADRPVVLDVDGRVVYSAHVYAWSGWGSVGGRFSQRTYASFARIMRRNWAYLVEGDVAPVWVGEFGASDRPSNGGANYWRNLVHFLAEVDADFGYWAVNPRKPKDNVRESYSLVKDDWATPVLDYRMMDMQGLMAGQEKGDE